MSLAPVPWALSGSNERISLIIELVSILMSESLVTVSMVWFLGRKLSFTSRGVINEIFEPLINAFKNDHGFLELLWDHQV